jgi:hypothetical protein
MADVNWEIGVFPTLHAVEKVRVFTRGAGVKMDFLFAGLGIENFLRTGSQRRAPAGVADPAVRAVEPNAVA